MASPDKGGRRVLYLSYDGMTDPLGGSQVLPYLEGLAERGHSITLVSCEKPERTAEERRRVEAICRAHGIEWCPLPYTKRPPVLSTVKDIVRMRRLAETLHKKHPFDMVHCRSDLPGLVGLPLKRRFGTAFLYDMRGFWADERVDGGLWDLRNPLYRLVYGWFRRRENEMLEKADAIVSLTEAGKAALLSRPGTPRPNAPIAVIPCCTDFGAFPPATAEAKASARRLLGIEPTATVVAYLGSIGTWYLLGEMLDFFAVQLARDRDARFLFVTRDPPEPILDKARRRGIPPERLIIRPASREEVPKLIAAADYGLFFIKPCFSKLASSPVKLGELLAMELPVVTNAGVGDVDRIVEEAGAGVLVPDFTPAAYEDALDRLAALDPDMQTWRKALAKWFDLQAGVEAYDRLYRELSPR